MDTPLISVIVPVYKVEAYLDRCVQSIVKQTYQNLEIILVDDGSPDNCPAMCDAWVEKDTRIKVIHKENGGLSDARNAGMAIATGVYMGFVDSDDYIASNMYQLLYEHIISGDCDIAACGVEMVWEDGMPSRRLTKAGSCMLDREAAMEACIRESWLKQPVWYKLYKTALIKDIPFPVGKYHEDVFWTWQAVARAGGVSVFDTPCYYYTQRSGSIMGVGYSLKRLDAIEAKQQRLKFMEECFPRIAGLAKVDLLFSGLYHMQQCLRYMTGKQKVNARFKIRKMMEQEAPYPRKTSLSTKQKLWYFLAQRDVELTAKLRNLLKIGL